MLVDQSRIEAVLTAALWMPACQILLFCIVVTFHLWAQAPMRLGLYDDHLAAQSDDLSPPVVRGQIYIL